VDKFAQIPLGKHFCLAQVVYSYFREIAIENMHLSAYNVVSEYYIIWDETKVVYVLNLFGKLQSTNVFIYDIDISSAEKIEGCSFILGLN